MSPKLNRHKMIDRDTSDRRCEDREMSLCSDRLMTTDGDTSGESVRTVT